MNRLDFPVLCNCVYLDSACMSLRPKCVVDSVVSYYTNFDSCAGRSSHSLSKSVEDKVVEVRKLVRKFIGAKKDSEIIFTSGATLGINIVAENFKGKRILVSNREHNSNVVPWLNRGCELVVVDSFEDGSFDLVDFKSKLDDVDLVSIVWKSNLDGYILPVKEIVKLAHAKGVKVLLDGAQAVPNLVVNVNKLGVDFLVFSGHKMLGPTGTGVLYVNRKVSLNPVIVGGGVVKNSTFDGFEWEDGAVCFEAGLQNYSGIFGLGRAIKYLMAYGMKNVNSKCYELMCELQSRLMELEGVGLVGVKDTRLRSGIVNFNVKGVSDKTIGLMLDQFGVKVRSGAHCVHAWYNSKGFDGSVRASLYFYNDSSDIDKFIIALKKVLVIVR